MERRKHKRISIANTLECAFRIGDSKRLEGKVENISRKGVLISSNDLDGSLLVDSSVPVCFEETGTFSDELLFGSVATVSWTYETMIGVEFPDQLLGSDEELERWLERHGYELGADPTQDPFQP